MSAALRKTQTEIVKVLTGMDVSSSDLNTVWEKLENAVDAYGKSMRYVPARTTVLKTTTSAFHDALRNIEWVVDVDAPQKFDQYGKLVPTYKATGPIPATAELDQPAYKAARRAGNASVEHECTMTDAEYSQSLISFQKNMKFNMEPVQKQIKQQLGY